MAAFHIFFISIICKGYIAISTQAVGFDPFKLARWLAGSQSAVARDYMALQCALRFVSVWVVLLFRDCSHAILTSYCRSRPNTEPSPLTPKLRL